MNFFDIHEQMDRSPDCGLCDREYDKTVRDYEKGLLRNDAAQASQLDLRSMSVKAVVGGGSEHFTRHAHLLATIPRPLAQLVLDEALKQLLRGAAVMGLVQAVLSSGLVDGYTHPSVQLNDRLLPALLKCPGLQKLECTQDVQYEPFSAKFTVKLHLLQGATAPGLRCLVWPLRDGRALLSSVAGLQQLEELDVRGFRLLRRSHVNMVAEAVADGMPSLRVLRLGCVSSHNLLRLVEGMLGRTHEPLLLLDASTTLEPSRLQGHWPPRVALEHLRLRAQQLDQMAVRRLRAFPAHALRSLHLEVAPSSATYLSLLDILGAHVPSLRIQWRDSHQEGRLCGSIDLAGILARVPRVTCFSCDLDRTYTEPSPEQLLRVPFENFERFHVCGLHDSELIYLEALLQRFVKLDELTISSPEQLRLVLRVLASRQPPSPASIRSVQIQLNESEAVADQCIELGRLLATRFSLSRITFKERALLCQIKERDALFEQFLRSCGASSVC